MEVIIPIKTNVLRLISYIAEFFIAPFCTEKNKIYFQRQLYMYDLLVNWISVLLSKRSKCKFIAPL